MHEMEIVGPKSHVSFWEVQTLVHLTYIFTVITKNIEDTPVRLQNIVFLSNFWITVIVFSFSILDVFFRKGNQVAKSLNNTTKAFTSVSSYEVKLLDLSFSGTFVICMIA